MEKHAYVHVCICKCVYIKLLHVIISSFKKSKFYFSYKKQSADKGLKLFFAFQEWYYICVCLKICNRKLIVILN